MSALDTIPPTITIRGQKTTLRPINMGIDRIINQLGDIEDVSKKASALLVAYAAIYSLSPAEALRVVSDEKEFNRVIGEAEMEISTQDWRAVDEYMTGVFTRTPAATPQIDYAPGKPTTEATSRPA